MRKKNKGEIKIADIKVYYKATVIITTWYWHKKRHTDQWNGIESSEINPSVYSQLIFDKGGRSIKWSKNILFKNGVGRSGQAYTKINSKWIKDLTISHGTMKFLEENIGRKISDIPCSNIFNEISPRAREIKGKK